jgi:hypothetical protein
VSRPDALYMITGQCCAYLLLLFAYTVSVWQLPQSPVCDFIVRCKGCGENIPAPVGTMPDTWIVTECPLCGERRSYLPPEIFRGRLSHLLPIRKPVKSDARFR